MTPSSRNQKPEPAMSERWRGIIESAGEPTRGQQSHPQKVREFTQSVEEWVTSSAARRLLQVRRGRAAQLYHPLSQVSQPEQWRLAGDEVTKTIRIHSR